MGTAQLPGRDVLDRAAMADAIIAAASDVHFVQVKCPLLTASRNEILVLGNSVAWESNFVIGHAVMEDALDTAAVDRAPTIADAALGSAVGTTQTDRLAALLCKAEASRTGTIRGHRHIMLDDSDIKATRHARALVGGVLAGRIGDTRLFVSGGAEHQGPEGGGPLAVIIALRS